MKAIGYKQNGPIDAPEALIEFETEIPEPQDNDLLVEVKGISVNPVDTKVRALMPVENEPKIIGYDASGIVRKVGPAVKNFKIGDKVFYAGDISRPGTNAEFHIVDARIVGRKPASLDFTQASALPLTSITAWELLFDSLHIQEGTGQGDAILIIGGAGGVGSILIQLAKKLTCLTVIATASRPETVDWVQKMGTDYVINHNKSLANQVKELGIEPRYIAALTQTDQHFSDMIKIVKPRGHIAVIDDPKTVDIKCGKSKALSFSWEYMFARPIHQTDDIEMQGTLLNRISELIDAGILVSTANSNLGEISVGNLKKAHMLQESGKVIGKNVLEGYL